MAEARFFQVSFSFAAGIDGKQIYKHEELEKLLNTLVLDWFRFGGNCWIVYTEKSANDIYEAIKPLLTNQLDRALIIEVNAKNRQGWMAKSFWDWLNKAR